MPFSISTFHELTSGEYEYIKHSGAQIVTKKNRLICWISFLLAVWNNVFCGANDNNLLTGELLSHTSSYVEMSAFFDMKFKNNIALPGAKY
eukprot:snap_masked-scaffold_29-processed-gene-2.33-mRNA-1 protein AED:1.00 eAED:1.00 QI:0/-1/0/0/-1/1/1/0/90